MAVEFVHLLETSSTSNVATYTSGSFTPTAGDLLMVFVGITGSTSTDWTLTDNAGGSWEKATLATGSTRLLKNASADFGEVWFRTTAASGAAMTVTYSHASGNATGGNLEIIAVRGAEGYGASVVRSYGKTDNIAASSTAASTLNQTPSAANALVTGIFLGTASPGTTVPSGFTSIRQSTGYSTPSTGFKIAGDTDLSGWSGTTITWGSTILTAGAAWSLEIIAASTTVQKSGSDAFSIVEALLTDVAIPVVDSAALSEGTPAVSQQTTFSASDAASLTEQAASKLETSDKAGSDSTVFTDSSSLNPSVSAQDTQATSESAAASVTASASEAHSQTETAATRESVDAKAGTDSYSTTEAAVASPSVAANESAAFAEQSSFAAAVSAAETHSQNEGTATAGVTDFKVGSDSWLLSEVVTSLLTTEPKTASDALTQSEGQTSIAAAISASDLWSALEQAGISAALTSSETLTSSEVAALLQTTQKSASDAFSASESSAIAATLVASDSSLLTDAVLDLASTVQKATADSFVSSEASNVATILVISRSDAFSVIEVAGVVEYTEALYIHHQTPLSGLVIEPNQNGTVVVVVAGGQIVSAVTSGTILDATSDGHLN